MHGSSEHQIYEQPHYDLLDIVVHITHQVAKILLK